MFWNKDKYMYYSLRSDYYNDYLDKLLDACDAELDIAYGKDVKSVKFVKKAPPEHVEPLYHECLGPAEKVFKEREKEFFSVNHCELYLVSTNMPYAAKRMIKYEYLSLMKNYLKCYKELVEERNNPYDEEDARRDLEKYYNEYLEELVDKAKEDLSEIEKREYCIFQNRFFASNLHYDILELKQKLENERIWSDLDSWVRQRVDYILERYKYKVDIYPNEMDINKNY